MRVEFSDFRDAFAALPPGPVSLDDARAPQFCIYKDRWLIAYYAPFDYVNTLARVVLVGGRPSPAITTAYGPRRCPAQPMRRQGRCR